MSTSVSIGVHTDEDIGVSYHERNGTSWVNVTSEREPAVSIFGPPERLRRLFAEALTAIPAPEPVVEAERDMAAVPA